MKKNLGVFPALYPMPVMVIAAYDENGTVQAMNAVWGMICSMDKVALSLGANHATTKALRERNAFTISLADTEYITQTDYLGILTGNTITDKFERSGLSSMRSHYVDAPLIMDLPVTLECEVLECKGDQDTVLIIGKIVNVVADEEVLGEGGTVDPTKLSVLVFDQFASDYYAIKSELVGHGWQEGAALAEVVRRQQRDNA